MHKTDVQELLSCFSCLAIIVFCLVSLACVGTLAGWAVGYCLRLLR